MEPASRPVRLSPRRFSISVERIPFLKRLFSIRVRRTDTLIELSIRYRLPSDRP